MATAQIFLSTVSAEFCSYRDALRRDLTRPNVTVAVQEDFIVTGTETLDMLDDYVCRCDAVVHLVGDMTGALAQAPSVAVLRQRYPDFVERLPPLAEFLQPDAPGLPYTQWEAWLALYHRKVLVIAVPEDGAPRDERYRLDDAERAAQQAHLARLASVERYPGIRFANADRLAVDVLRSALLDILDRVGGPKKPANLPYASLGALFKGRDASLDALAASFGRVADAGTAQAVARALHGLGGVGKTRFALEYAWRHAERYTALLFAGADGPETLQRSLAALCGAAILDLPEQALTDEARQCDAVLAWLHRHPGWVLILDNIDSEAAARAAEALLPRLTGGHVLLTSRLSNWSGSVQPWPVDLLAPRDAADFLLARTEARRRRQPGDDGDAGRLAEELGRLALALEQAGAYIAQQRLGFGQYEKLWQAQRQKVLAWSAPRLMQYPHSVAATWLATFEQLDPSARRLLERLAWLAPQPIPESLLEVPASTQEGEDADDALAALAVLESYSLASRAADAPTFSVHLLVQEVTRSHPGAPAQERLEEALRWINDAFVGDPSDVRNWPVLDPLVPHARAVVAYAAEAGMAKPTARLMNQVGRLFLNKAQYAEAEPLMRHALAIDEASFGAEHPNVAVRLNNLAQLLKDTNRLAEAEPLMRRALAIDDASFGAGHPNVAVRLSNLATLLHDTNRLAEAEPLMRRALAIDDASFGAGHPKVARHFSNLAQLLKATNRLAEAEPLMRRALAIDEASFGPEHPKVATRLNNLAALLQATNRLAEAEPLMRRALTIDEASFGPEHPKVAIRLSNLAHLLHATNRLAEAEPLIRRALTIDEFSFGPEHPKVAIRLNNLAQLLKATNRLTEAEPLMRRALTIDEASFGAEHPEVAIDLNNLARLLQATNRLAEAEPLMHRALTINVTSFGLKHPTSQLIRGNYVELLKAMGKTDDDISAELATVSGRA